MTLKIRRPKFFYPCYVKFRSLMPLFTGPILPVVLKNNQQQVRKYIICQWLQSRLLLSCYSSKTLLPSTFCCQSSATISLPLLLSIRETHTITKQNKSCNQTSVSSRGLFLVKITSFISVVFVTSFQCLLLPQCGFLQKYFFWYSFVHLLL